MNNDFNQNTLTGDYMYHKTKNNIKYLSCFVFALFFAIVITFQNEIKCATLLYIFSVLSLICFFIHLALPNRKVTSTLFGLIYISFCVLLVCTNSYSSSLIYVVLPIVTMTIFPFRYAIVINSLLTLFALGFQSANIILDLEMKSQSYDFINIYLASFIISFFVDYLSHIKTLRLQSMIKRIDCVSKTDSLTMIPNRYSFNEYFQSNAENNSPNYSIIMIDIDRFKDYNDYYGHITADEVLKLVASTMQKVCKDQDSMIARWGGEEFIVLLNKSSLDSAIEVAEQIRKAVEDLKIEHKGLGDNHYVTISLGVSHQTEPNSYDKTLSNADKALYIAKTSGRNRVEHIE